MIFSCVLILSVRCLLNYKHNYLLTCSCVSWQCFDMKVCCVRCVSGSSWSSPLCNIIDLFLITWCTDRCGHWPDSWDVLLLSAWVCGYCVIGTGWSAKCLAASKWCLSLTMCALWGWLSAAAAEAVLSTSKQTETRSALSVFHRSSEQCLGTLSARSLPAHAHTGIQPGI